LPCSGRTKNQRGGECGEGELGRWDFIIENENVMISLRFLNAPNPPHWSRVLFYLILASVFSFCLSTPRILNKISTNSLFKEDGWKATYQKADNLTATLSNFPKEKNAAKRVYRLTLPAVIIALGTPPPVTIYLIQLFLGLFLMFFFYKICLGFLTWQESLLLTIILPFLYYGRSAWVDLSGWFDTCAYFLIVLGLWTRIQPLKILLFLLAFWTDERALLCFPIVLIWENRDFILKSEWFNVVNLKTLVLCTSPLLYILGRIYLQNFYGLSTPSGDLGLASMKKTLANFSLAQISFFEGYWILIGLFLKEIWLTKRWGLLFLFLFLLINGLMDIFNAKNL
jgi:hypothetical protein